MDFKLIDTKSFPFWYFKLTVRKDRKNINLERWKLRSYA